MDTELQAQGQTYRVTVDGVADLSARGNTVQNARAFFAAYVIESQDAFSWDFNVGLPEGSEIVGSAEFSPTEGVNGSGALILTRNIASQQGCGCRKLCDDFF